MDGANTIEVEIVQPCRPVGRYRVLDDQTIQLEEILYPDANLPFDLATVPNTLTIFGDSLQVILIGELSHPPLTRLEAGIIGGVRLTSGEIYLIATPTAEKNYDHKDQESRLDAELHEHLYEQLGNGSEIEWLREDALMPLLEDARVKYRQARLTAIRDKEESPAWRPLDQAGRVVGYTEAEHYTDAEYTYFQLPYRFQKYVGQHLADDERILFALHRPEMKSERDRTWFTRKKLNEGVLILTTQRLISLVELIPLGNSGVQYGFEAKVGILERLREAVVELSGNENLLLKTTWAAQGGTASLEFELPLLTMPEVEGLKQFLDRFISDMNSSCALRKIGLPEAPEALPPLSDLATDDLEELESINRRFVEILPASLESSEKAIAWALWPGWFENKGYARILVVTDRYLRLLPDPTAGLSEHLQIPLERIAALEYVASVLDSRIGLIQITSEGQHTIQLHFHYPAEKSFNRCFEALRRCVASIPSL